MITGPVGAVRAQNSKGDVESPPHDSSYPYTIGFFLNFWLWVRALRFLQRSLLGGQGGYNTSVFVKLITPTVLLVVNKEI